MCLIEDNFQVQSSPILGGDGIVVIIDSIQVTTSFQHEKYLIGFVELKAIPVSSHFEYAECNNNIDLDACVALIKSIVVPGSWIVLEDNIFLDDYPKLLSDVYPVVRKRSDIEQHNTDEQKALDNLKLVWVEQPGASSIISSVYATSRCLTAT